jgi:hypothetical protein
METRTEVKTFEIDMLCDKCGGKMRPTGLVHHTCPPQFPHECKTCHERQTYRMQYPYIKHVTVEQDEALAP